MVDLNELVSAQLRQPPGATRAAQSVSPRPTPRGTPVRDDLMRDTHLSCDLGGDHTLLEQVGGTHAPLLHRGKVAARPHAPHHRCAALLLYGNTGHA